MKPGSNPSPIDTRPQPSTRNHSLAPTSCSGLAAPTPPLLLPPPTFPSFPTFQPSPRVPSGSFPCPSRGAACAPFSAPLASRITSSALHVRVAERWWPSPWQCLRAQASDAGPHRPLSRPDVDRRAVAGAKVNTENEAGNMNSFLSLIHTLACSCCGLKKATWLM